MSVQDVSVDESLASQPTVRAPARRDVSPKLGLAVVAVTLALWLAWVVATAASSGGRYDFESYYLAATALRLDPHANIYASAVIAHAASLTGPLPYHPLPYTYPPLLAILLVPLSLAPFAMAANVWLILNAALWLVGALMLADEVCHILSPDPSTLPSRRFIISALAATLPLCLLSWPAASALLLGQVGILVFVPLALVPRLLRQGHDEWAGAAIALAAMLKFTPALLLAYLVLTRRWRALRGACIALAALALLCVLVVGPGVTLQAVPQAIQIGSADAAHANNQALFGVLTLVVHATVPTLDAPLRLLQYAVLLAIAVITALLLARHARRLPAERAVATHWGEQDAAALAFALCAVLLLAPVAWSHHYTWLLPANALVLGYALRHMRGPFQEGERQAAVRQLTIVVVASLLINIAAADALQRALDQVSLVVLGFTLGDWTNALPSIGALILFGVAARQLRAIPAPRESPTHKM